MKARPLSTGPLDRPSRPVRNRNGTCVIDIETYAPFLINVVANAWQRKTSTLFRQKFGLGISEWRVISMLNIEPGITANRICEVIQVDKAAASRSLNLLAGRGYLRFEAQPNDERKRRWWLSETGAALHDELMAIALGSEAEMIAGVAPGDLEVFLKVMRRLRSNLTA